MQLEMGDTSLAFMYNCFESNMVIISTVAFLIPNSYTELIAFLQSVYGTLLTIYFSVKGESVMVKKMVRKMVWYGVPGVTKVF